MDDGKVVYSYDKKCEAGRREWIDAGTFSTVRNQTVRAYDPVHDTIRIPNLDRGRMDQYFGDR
jgi:hypothetical protein